VVTSQQTLDFLDKAAWYCCHRFYIRNDELILLNLNESNGTTLLGGFGYTPPVYTWAGRIKKVTAKWQTRYAEAPDLKEQEHEISVAGSHPVVGNEKEMPFVLNEDESLVTARIQALISWLEKPEIEIKIPIYRFPLPLEEYIFSDQRGNTSIGATFRAESIRMDYKGKMVAVAGRGQITFS